MLRPTSKLADKVSQSSGPPAQLPASDATQPVSASKSPPQVAPQGASASSPPKSIEAVRVDAERAEQSRADAAREAARKKEEEIAAAEARAARAAKRRINRELYAQSIAAAKEANSLGPKTPPLPLPPSQLSETRPPARRSNKYRFTNSSDVKIPRSPLTANSLVIDSQIAIAIRRKDNGLPLDSSEQGWIDWAENRVKQGHALRITDRSAVHEVRGRTLSGFKSLQLKVSRSSEDYLNCYDWLDATKEYSMPVGGSEGFADREIVADTIMAERPQGVVPSFATADRGIYEAMAQRAGLSLRDVRSLARKGGSFVVRSFRDKSGTVHPIEIIPLSGY